MPGEQDDIDQILADIEAPSADIPMTGGEPDPSQPAAAPEAPAWNGKEWEFDHNGKKVAPDSREKALTWMSQGHNYSQRTAEHNMAVKAWEKHKADIEAKYQGYDRYAEIDKYARENPQWWEHAEKSYAQRDQLGASQHGQVDPAFQEILRPLQEQVRQMAEERQAEKQRLDQEKAHQEQERLDKALSTDIESIRAANPNIDFDAVDESGRPLELRILAHAQEIGTTSFRAAFRDYLHDQLQESAKAQSLSAQAQVPKAQKAAGILGTSPTPRKAPNAPVSTKGRSWDDLARVAMDDYGVSS